MLDKHFTQKKDAIDDVFHVSVTELEDGDVYNIFLFDSISSPEQFIPAIEALQIAEPTDEVVVHVSTPGGCIDATDTFLDAVRACVAPVRYIASGGCHSAGTMILMHAENVRFSAGFNALVHCGSTATGGTTAEYKAASKFNISLMERLLAEAYKGFMSDEEIESLLEGKDFWFDAEEFKKRHAARVQYLKS